MKMTVPTMGIKFNGRYMTYRMRALGLYFSKGLFKILPRRSMGSLPDFSCRPPLTTPVAFLETRVPSNVSSRASWSRKLRDMIDTRVELSFRTSRTVVKTARGPFTKTRMANCGR